MVVNLVAMHVNYKLQVQVVQVTSYNWTYLSRPLQGFPELPQYMSQMVLDRAYEWKIRSNRTLFPLTF